MSRPRPKFCVGEQVLAESISTKNLFGPYEITAVRWTDNEDFMVKGVLSAISDYKGWVYSLSEQTAIESQLRKLPPEERTQWGDCAWQPNNNEVTA